MSKHTKVLLISFFLLAGFAIKTDFAMAASRYWVGGGSSTNWSATTPTNWSDTSGGANNASVPTSADDVFFDANSGTGNSVISAAITINSFDATGYTGTLTHNASVTLTIAGGGVVFKLSSGMTYTKGSTSSSALSFTGTSGTTTITTASKQLGNVTFNGVGGTWQLQDAINLGNSGFVTLTNGTFDANNFNVSIGNFSSSNSNIRTLIMGSGTWSISNGGTVASWNITTATNMTLNANTSTINLTGVSDTATQTFGGGGLTYYNLNIPSGTDTDKFTGSNTFNTFTINSPKKVTFTSGTTQTVSNFVALGTAGNIITINSSTAGSPATLSKSSGNICSDYLSIKDSTAAGGAGWYAGANSTDALGNTGWTFSACPSGDTTPPTVSISSPTNGSTVSGNTTVSATASDNVGVAGVQFKLDGSNLGAEDTSSPYSISWDTTTASNASHTLTAVARDAAGNTTTSGSVTVTVSNTISAPVINSATTSTGTVGSAFSYQITATNSPTSYNATGLPAGLSVNTTSGLVSGTPTVAGNSSVTLSATNAGGTGTATLTLTINPAPSASSAPVIFFTDLDSGPKIGGENNNGSIVTIYGKNFGSTRGSSTVTVGGGVVAAYLSWSDTKIAVAIGSNAATGNVVVITSATSNGVPFTVRGGNIKCVSTTGSDTNSGDFPSSCWATITKAETTIAAGDIAYILDGVSQTVIEANSSALYPRSSGTAGNPKALVAYPGATVAVGTTGIQFGINFNSASPGAGAKNYWVISGLQITALVRAIQWAGSTTVQHTGFRIVGNDMTCPLLDSAGGSSCFGGNSVDNVVAFGNTIHDVGPLLGTPTDPKLDHGVYFNLGVHDLELGWNTVRNVNMCRGVQFYDAQYNLYNLSVHDNVIHDTRCDGLNLATVDPSVGYIRVYNNVIYRSGLGTDLNPGSMGGSSCVFANDVGPAVGVQGGNYIEIFNNTMYDCAKFDGTKGMVTIQQKGISGTGGAPDPNSPVVRLRNNIFHQVSGRNYVFFGSSGTGSSYLTGDTNVWYGSLVSAPTQTTGNITTDPSFVSTITPDFHLQSTSPARDAGIITTALFDLDGVSRPQGSSFDLGAYEYPSGAVADTTFPTVSITSPTSGATLSGSTNTISANASDNIGVVGVQFKLDGVNLGFEDTSSPYSINWDTTSYTNGTYSITAVARDPSGNSTTSTAINVNVSNVAPPVPPVISSVNASSITTTGATITWTTDKSSDSQVEYGLTTSYGSSTTLDSTLVTSHTVALSGLTSQTTYHYRVKSQDTPGNLATSGDFTFTTATPPPVISNVQATNITATSVIITWTTDRATTSKVNYGLSSSYSSSTVKDINLVINHSVSIGSLSSSTLYHYQVESTDSGNLTSTSTDATFSTLAPPTLPIISNVQATNIISTGATITWTTDKSSDSQVEYGLTTSYGSSTTLDSTLVTSHTVTLSGLSPSTLYNYRVKSGGSVSTNHTFTTPGPPDTTAPAQTTNLSVNTSTRTNTSLTLSWTAPGDDGTTGTATTYQIRWYVLPITDANWNTAFALSGVPAPQIAGSNQTYTAIGLTPNTTYYFAMKTLDEAGNISPLSNIANGTTKQNAPNNVSNLTAAASDKTVQLDWNAPAGANTAINYAIIRNTAGGLTAYNATGGNSLIYSGTDAFFADTTVSNGTTYYYSVFAYYDLGTYSSGVSVSALPQSAGIPVVTKTIGGGSSGSSFTDITPTQPVKISRIGEADSQILLEWNNPSDEDFIRVLIVRNEDHQPAAFTDGETVLEDNVQKFIDTNLINGKTYYYTIYTLDLARNLSKPVEVKAIPKEGVFSFPENVEPLDIAQTTNFIAPEVPAEENISAFVPRLFPKAALVRYAFDKNVYYISNGHRRLVPNYATLLKLTGNKPNKVLTILDSDLINGYLSSVPIETKEITDLSKNISAASALVKTKDKPTVYLVNTTDKTKQVIPSLAVFYSYGFSFKNVSEIKTEDLENLTDSGELTLQVMPNGFLMKSPDSYKVYVMQDGQKRWITNLKLFLGFKYIDKDVTTLPKELIEAYQSGSDIERQDETLPNKFQIKVPATIHANTTLVKLKDNHKVYLVENGRLKWIETLEEFKEKKYQFKNVVTITQDEFGLYGGGEEVTSGENMGETGSESEGSRF